jgi:hypothetical protein
MIDTLTTLGAFLGIVFAWNGLFWLFTEKPGKGTLPNVQGAFHYPLSSPLSKAWAVDYLVLKGHTRKAAEELVNAWMR